jgi:hypothetical protein
MINVDIAYSREIAASVVKTRLLIVINKYHYFNQFIFKFKKCVR